MPTGKNLIAGETVDSADGRFDAGGALAHFEEASRAHVDSAADAAAGAFDAYRAEEIFPGPGVGTDAEIETFVRRKAETIYHPAGTCRMGIGADAVVDSELRVYGVEGLRVVDASIMPTLIGGNTNAPSIMIGEKVADMMRRAA